MLRRIRLLCLTVLLSVIYTTIPVAASGLPTETDKLLRMVDDEIRLADSYAARRYIRADSLVLGLQRPASSDVRFELLRQLGSELSFVDSDSALIVFRQGVIEARDSADIVWEQRFMINQAHQLHQLGLDVESIRALDRVRDMGIRPEVAAEFSIVALVINTDLYDLHPAAEEGSRYIRRAIKHAENLIALASPAERNGIRYKLCQALIARESNNKALLAALLQDVVDSTEVGSTGFSEATLMLGDYYKSAGRSDDAINSYALGTIADLRNSNFHGRSLIRLAEELYDAGDISRAYNYMTNALDLSLRAGSKVNQTELSNLLKPTSDDYRRLENRRLLGVVIMAVVLLIALGVILRMMYSLRREMKQLREMKQRLSASNEAKELYIGQYLSLCSTFLERLEDFSRTCRRKITAGQTEDLLNFIKSGKTIEEQRSTFYNIFDDTFIHIYPTFVSEVNALLLPDKQIPVTGTSSLTPELRILAFQRLGIDDTAKVARFLGLSLNTIYTYRNKLRSRAINRDTFDRDVMNIGIIS